MEQPALERFVRLLLVEDEESIADPVRRGLEEEGYQVQVAEDGGLLRALARVRAIGSEMVVHSTPTTPLGAITAPAIVLAGVEGFRPR